MYVPLLDGDTRPSRRHSTVTYPSMLSGGGGRGKSVVRGRQQQPSPGPQAAEMDMAGAETRHEFNLEGILLRSSQSLGPSPSHFREPRSTELALQPPRV